MLIGREEEHIELELLEQVSEHSPTPGDVHVRATVKIQEFGGSYSGVWLSQPDLTKFVEQLKTLIAPPFSQEDLKLSEVSFSLYWEPFKCYWNRVVPANKCMQSDAGKAGATLCLLRLKLCQAY